MPLLELHTNVNRPENVAAIVEGLSALLAEATGKPLQYIMVRTSFDEAMAMGGTTAPAAFLRLSSIGKIGHNENKGYSAKICKFLTEHLGIEADRVYINFVDVSRANWGYNGGTFA
ncbi:hypothetical protein PTSG_12443 [Salpingoeca rosetta]|uniref:L-dopachrome isomerase n=1 Tax=Salpingoeca rosetta (strain ATCC 50818 / BSB-021) TaxID=946362 RepID=F2UBZ7_SALR5|nr:uncharacterized protein PTSG_12443 [Salpingoeca rosetta]EGD74412.1 hypothetical protein PTSG_12443 [Salpingoeca rosetta]|eukprot:XP_004993312.1 hypothetical protein PTSG_12443 [Salpingoeca rosetta]